MSTTRLGLRPMRPRPSEEADRAASPLELLFDLVFVVAVSFCSQQLHHMEAQGELVAGVVGYLMLFFAIWWAWMNFTWFATSFDNDDWLYRVATITQMAGVLVLAAGTHDAMVDRDFAVVTIGYVVMRMALVAQWLRAALSDQELRQTALRYAAGITVVQALWLIRLALPETLGLVGFVVLATAELAVPVWAERKRATPWNAHHITERFGLFTLILIGESIVASATGIAEAVEAAEHVADLTLLAFSGLGIAAGLWWVYFAREQHHLIGTLRSSLTFGYTHYLIFAAAGAFPAGIEVAADAITHHTEIDRAVGATLAVPVAIFLLGVWALHLRTIFAPAADRLFLVGVGVVCLSCLPKPPWSVAIAAIGTLMAVVAAERHREPAAGVP